MAAYKLINYMQYFCLVCGYPGLEEQPFDGKKFHSTHEICPSCGFHYGYDDLNGSGEYPDDFKEKEIIKAYRNKWLNTGSKWWSSDKLSPSNWDAIEQIKKVPQGF